MLALNLAKNRKVSSELCQNLEAFTCLLYGSKNITDVNKLRYAIFCAKGGEVESQQLPPCGDTLQKHILRTNYQAAIWRRCLHQYPNTPNPNGYGWKTSSGSNELKVDWMNGLPAPDAVLELLSCKCTRVCCSKMYLCGKQSKMYRHVSFANM